MARRLLSLTALTLALGCGYTAPPDRLDTAPCRQWRVIVSNGSSEQAAVYVSGEGPERFLGFVGPMAVRSWVLASEPDRVEARGGVRDEVRGVEIAISCLSR